MNKAFVAVTSSLFIVVGAVVTWSWQSEAERNDAASASAMQASPTTQATDSDWFKGQAHDASAEHIEKLALHTDSGHLHISARTLPALDAFLAQHAGEPAEVIGERFKTALKDKLNESGQAEAADLMTRYANYRAAVAEAEKESPEALNLDGQNANILKLHRSISLRHHFLGEAFQTSLYGEQEAQQRHQLAKQEILSIQGISETQRAELLNDLDATHAKPTSAP